MRSILKLFVFVFFGLVLMSEFTAPAVLAQTRELQATMSATPTIAPPISAINLTLSPITLQFDVKPGQVQTAEVRIRNNGNETEHLKASFGSFSFNQRTNDIDLSQEIQTEDKDWISIDQTTFEVDPLEWKTLKVTFSPPTDAVLTHYYAVIFSRVVSAQTQSGETAINGAPAILVLTNVESPLGKRELQIDQFFANRFWVEFLPQTFRLKIKNTGNIHLVPSGNIFIDGQGKKDIAVLSINPKNSMILPNSSRDFAIDWEEGFPKWVKKPVKEQNKDGNDMELQWDFSQANKFRIGKYTAHLLLVYDNGERDVPIESAISFWVIPWRIFVAILGAVLLSMLLGILLYLLIKKIRERNKKYVEMTQVP